MPDQEPIPPPPSPGPEPGPSAKYLSDTWTWDSMLDAAKRPSGGEPRLFRRHAAALKAVLEEREMGRDFPRQLRAPLAVSYDANP